MELDKKKYNIYLVSAIITAGLVFMGVSTYYISGNIGGESSRDILIDKQVDQCYADLEKAN